LAHLYIIFALFSKTYDLLQNLLNVALEWFFSFSTKLCKTKCDTLKDGPHGISRKKGDCFDRLP